ncbi:SAM-dependent methyltransferase [Plantactinospora sp. KBS50]|uniref:SAM-dependent methyltransferase n=1 Tax=Plantactinospora sp. KBS50 TaxID=2024580 RepID=UPI000BAAC69C|nr:SAM-dependent methyltransferase [Plantactinospora sp. KBS50]ASW55220.1 methyltransferase [Plantactinospora sp. KBS50]
MAKVDLRTDVAHSARVYDYLLGGKDNFEADRAAAARMIESTPALPVSMRANRRFMQRAATYLAAERGIRQFLDVGTGLPTSPNLHEVVQGVDPRSRVVYVDNDPIVLVHARALLTSSPEGRTTYLDADLRRPASILDSAEVRATLDFDQPVAVTLIAVLQHLTDEDEARRVIRELVAALPTGSALAVSAVTVDSLPDNAGRTVATYNSSGIPAKARTRDEVEALFQPLRLVEPGVTLVNRWRPDGGVPDVDDNQVYMYGGVALKD